MNNEMYQKVERLYKNAKISIPYSDIKDFVEKYGENAYNIALGIIRQPTDVSRELDVSIMGSKGLTYVMLRNDISETTVNNILNAVDNYVPNERVQTVPANGMISVRNPEIDYSSIVPEATAGEIEDINRRANTNANRRLEGMYPSNKVMYVNRLRKEDFVTRFPIISREGKTDQEYLNELAQQYVAMKNEQFKYAYKQAGLSGYVTARCCTIDERKEITCNGTEQTVGEKVGIRLEYIEPTDSAFIAYNGKYEATHDCAASTAKQVIYASTTNMGTYGNNNIFEKNGGFLGAYNSHDWMERIHGDEYSNASENGSSSTNLSSQKTLKEYIEDGVMDIGSTFSIKGGGPSGFHYMSVVDVVRDENDNVISYTVCDHNGGGADENDRLIVSPPNKRFDNQPVIYTLNQDIKTAEFEGEVADVLKIQPIEKAIAQMEQMVNTTRFEVVSDGGLLDRLASTEHEVLFGERWKKHCGVGRVSYLTQEQEAYQNAYFSRYDPLIKADLERESANLQYDGLALSYDLKREEKARQQRREEEIRASMETHLSSVAAKTLYSDTWDKILEGKVDLQYLGHLSNIDEGYMQALQEYKQQKGISDDNPRWNTFMAMCNNALAVKNEEHLEFVASTEGTYVATKEDEKLWKNIIKGKVKDLSEINFGNIEDIEAYLQTARTHMNFDELNDEEKIRWNVFMTMCKNEAVVRRTADTPQAPTVEGQSQTVAQIADREDIKSTMHADYTTTFTADPTSLAATYTTGDNPFARSSNSYEGLPEYMKVSFSYIEDLLPQLWQTYTQSSEQTASETLLAADNRGLEAPISIEDIIAASPSSEEASQTQTKTTQNAPINPLNYRNSGRA